VKLSTGQVVVLVGGVGLLGYFLLRRPSSGASGGPLGIGDFFDTLMPNAPDQQQIADWFAARSGRQPSPAGTSGYGATSTMPAYAGAIASLGNSIANIFARHSGPGNTSGAGQARPAMSSGGGVAQPVPGISMPIFQGQLYLPNTDWALDSQLSGLWNNIDSGLYDAPGGDWLQNENVSAGIDY